MSTKSGFPLVALANADQIERVLEVEEREMFATVDTVEQITGEWKRIPVLLHNLVKTAVVDAET